jgi:2-desacetyl-2-hydroxyethyl bacteriochlorophyllide A dehydrogenase
MKALHFDGRLSLRDEPDPEPAQDEALIRVRLAGICGTDLQILKGYSGFRGIPGHEFVGEVAECADKSWIGRRVVGEINVTCGQCQWCRRGLGRHCVARTVMGIIGRPGAFAEYVTLPVANLHEVPVEVPDEEAVFVEPLAAAAEILEQMPLARGTRAAVLGAGRLGLLAAQVLHHAGAEVTVIGRSEWKLKLAQSWGLTTALLGVEGVAGRSFAVVVEATSSPESLELALNLVEPRGTVVMKSTFHEPAHFDTANLVVNEITLLGSRCGNFATALDLLKTDAVHVEEMISRVFTLADGLDAFAYLETASCLKVLLRNDERAGQSGVSQSGVSQSGGPHE